MSAAEAMAEKIGKLLAKAERTENPHEAEAFTAKAERLMIRWGIEEATARATNSAQAAPEKIIEVRLTFETRYGLAIIQGLSEVVHALGLKSFRRGNRLFYIVGHESDVARAKVLCTSLHLQATTAMWHWWKTDGSKDYYWSEADKLRERRAFYSSFGAAVGARLRQTREQETDAVPGSALVLVSREQQLDEHMAANYQIGKGRAKGYGSNYAGHRAGQRADLGHSQLSSARKELTR